MNPAGCFVQAEPPSGRAGTSAVLSRNQLRIFAVTGGVFFGKKETGLNTEQD
jgi:hypothetical protein